MLTNRQKDMDRGHMNKRPKNTPSIQQFNEQNIERKIEIKHKITTSQKNSIQKDQLMKSSSSSF